MTWTKTKDRKPAIGQKVLAWFPLFEHCLGYFDRDGRFYEAHQGRITELPEPEFWKYLESPTLGDDAAQCPNGPLDCDDHIAPLRNPFKPLCETPGCGAQLGPNDWNFCGKCKGEAIAETE